MTEALRRNRADSIREAAVRVLERQKRPMRTADLAASVSAELLENEMVNGKTLYNCLYDDPSRFQTISPGTWALKK